MASDSIENVRLFWAQSSHCEGARSHLSVASVTDEIGYDPRSTGFLFEIFQLFLRAHFQSDFGLS